LGTGGGFSPLVLTEDFSVTVVVPPGPLAWVSDLTLLSSEHPESPIPKPVNKTPTIAVLINFRMKVASMIGTRTASDLT